MLIHSYIYYTLGLNIISDDKWQDAANELRDIQNNNPPIINWYDDSFNDWTGDTGMHLPKDEWVVGKSNYILQLHERKLTKIQEEDKKETKYIYY